MRARAARSAATTGNRMPMPADPVREHTRAGPAADYVIRPVATAAEFEACGRLQAQVWGERFSERIPPGFLKIAQRYAGVVLGAFRPDGTLCGFVFGFTGLERGRPVHWSDMLAILPGDRDLGLGRRLKLEQRAAVLGCGVSRMYWSFDALESRNAHLNFARLGIVADRYELDMYGETDSPLHDGIGTDRLIALWELDSDRVRDRIDLGAPPPGLEALAGAVPAHTPTIERAVLLPGEPALDLDAARITLAIPASIQQVKALAPEAATAWRRTTRAVLARYLTNGWRITELVRDPPYAHYLLEQTGR